MTLVQTNPKPNPIWVSAAAAEHGGDRIVRHRPIYAYNYKMENNRNILL